MECGKLIVLVGISGSGKSNIAERLALTENAKIISSDTIRKIYGYNPQSKEDNRKTFKKVYDTMHWYLMSQYNIIFDATNLTIKERKEIFKG